MSKELPPEVTVNGVKINRLTYLLLVKMQTKINEDLEFNAAMPEIVSFILDDWTKMHYLSGT